MKGRQGFTLMELLVVLLIIAILSTVALRTIDATRDRSLFDQTTDEMNKLVQAIVGNPDLTYDGRRVDFGYYGDMESLPGDLRDLVHNSGDPAWKGPYLRLTAQEDTAGYLYDGWGREYTWNPSLGQIQSLGNGKFPMHMKIVDDLRQLDNNVVSGSFLDRDGNPPGYSVSNLYEVRLYYNNRWAHGGTEYASVIPEPGGSYEISNTPDGGNHVVPIGIHEMRAIHPDGETLTRYVTVVPRSHTVVDFRFSSSFWEKLRMVGSAQPTPDGDGFRLYVVNDQATPVIVNWLHFYQTPESAYMRDFYIDGNPGIGFPRTATAPGVGNGDTAYFTPVSIAPDGADLVELLFQWFYPVAIPTVPPDTTAKVSGKLFQLRFSDNSEIKFTVPYP